MAGDGMSDRWITNLESDEKIVAMVNAAAEALATAEAADPQEEFKLRLARTQHTIASDRMESHIRTVAELRAEYPDFQIGEPRATKTKGAAAIKADGYVGLYRAPGA